MLNFEINFLFYKVWIWKLFSIYGKFEFGILDYVINYLMIVGKRFDLPSCPLLFYTCMRQTFNKFNAERQMEQPG